MSKRPLRNEVCEDSKAKTFDLPAHGACINGYTLRLAGVVSMLALGLPLAGSAAPRQQLSGGHVPAAVARLAPAGGLPGTQRLNLAIGLPLRNEQELDALLQQLYDPASPNYHRYLTPEEFTARFGPTENDYQALVDFAKSNGLTVTVTHPNRVVLDVSGAVTDIERTFHLTLRVYQHPKEARTFYAPDVEPSVDFAGPILHVSGLDNYSLPHPNFKVKQGGAVANATPNAGTGPGGAYLGSDFRTAYVPGTTLTGTGQSVGLLEFDGFYPSDITRYESQAGLTNVPLPVVAVVAVDGGISAPGTNVAEVSLDIEMAISMAPGLAGVYVYEAPNSTTYWDDVLSRMANDNFAKQLSCSWSGGSPDATAEQIFKQMASQGQSFFNATGDSDAFTGSIPFPSDSTNITEVGGTTLTTGSGASYSSEIVWNRGGGEGSSGGISTYYAMPSYQPGIITPANQGSTTMRNLPDVALTAENVYVVYGNGSVGNFGGTSCAAPLWAGFTALVNQQSMMSSNTTVGFLNPALYAIGKGANYTTAFHDITTGNNFSSSSTNKFSAVTGYDLCTGWGTPNGTNLINILAPPAPWISSQPQSQTVTVGSAVTFSLAASGCQPLSYKWRRNGVNISGATSASYAIPSVKTNQAGSYTVVVSNASGTATSSNAVLTVNVPPSITVQPQSLSVNAGNNVTNSVTASGTAPLSYQWYQNNSPIPGATAASYTITGVQPTNAGDYMVTVSNVAGMVGSTNATLTVQFAPVITGQPQSQNLSVGQSVTLMVVATGVPPPTYLWKFNGAIIPGATSNTYTLGSFEPTDVGTYAVVVSNSLGRVTSSNAVLAVAVCVLAPSGLVSWWQAEGNANDTMGCNSGVLVNGATFALGRVGQAFSFDGTNSYIRIADNPSLHFTNALTIEAWIYPTSLGTYHNIVSKWGVLDPLQTAYTTAVVPDGRISLAVCASTNQSVTPVVCTVSTNSVPPNQWTHFAATYDGSALRMYLNGVCEDQVAYSQGVFPGTEVLAIGAAGAFAGGQVLSPFAGLIDEAAVYNRALSPAEIAAIYNASSAGKCSSPPTVLTQPANQTVLVSDIATFTVAAGGTPPLSYQWYQNNSAIAGATNGSYTIASAQATNAGSYDVIVWNNSGSVTSAVAMLTVWTPPAITQQPVSLVVTQGSSASFSVSASGDMPLSYQWRLGSQILSGATTASYTIASAQATDAGSYDVIVWNNCGSVTSGVATLTVQYAPIIITQPQSLSVNQGASVRFSVRASGVPAPAFQWRLNAAPIAGATSSVFTCPNVQPTDAGTYSVAISNALGQTNSADAFLAVLVPLPGIYNTGLSDSGTLLADGQVDPHYKLVLNPNNPASSNSVVQDSTAWPIAGGPWIPNSSMSKWIGPAFNTVGAATGNYSYQLSVDLTGYDPRTAFLAGSWAADDTGSIFLNGVDTGFLSTNYFASFSTFTLTNGFVLGTNLIEFRISNAASPTGLRVENLQGTLQPETVPFVGTQPEGATSGIGDNVTFAVVAGGASPLSYQWRFNGADISTATAASLTLTNVQLSQAGNYDVIVSNNCGSVTSGVATLTVGILAEIDYDFETAATSPVWLGATQMIQNTSASHQGTNAIAFTGAYPNACLLTQLPEGTRNVQFYFYDDYGPNPPLYQYMYFWLLEATNSTGFAGFSMLDGGWGTTPPMTMNHYYAWGQEEYSARTMGPIRTVGWHKFAFAVGPSSVAMSVDDTPVFQTNMVRTARYLKLQCGQGGGWGRMDDLLLAYVTVPQPTLTISLAGNGIRIAWPASATGFVLQETISPPGNWVNSSAAVVVQGNENVAVIAPTGTLKFYRLQK
jgi:hypothetical protein